SLDLLTLIHTRATGFSATQFQPSTNRRRRHQKVNPKLLKSAEWIVAILISVAVLFVFFIRATPAGGLWRDECDSVELARLPTFVDVLHNLKFTSFPILFPTAIRLFTNLFGTSDVALRTFGFLIGAAFLLVAWFNARTNRY